MEGLGISKLLFRDELFSFYYFNTNEYNICVKLLGFGEYL